MFFNKQKVLDTSTSAYRKLKILYSVLSFFCIVVCLSACVNSQKLVYFPNQGDTIFANLPKPPAAIIKESDVLGITVTSLNAAASVTFNAPNAQATSSTGTLGVQNGYLVDSAGFITFPFLDQVKASGLTTAQLAAKLKSEILARKLLLEPIINVRQLNYHITLIGEVSRPGVYTIANEKINLLEALGQAGELTPYANRQNVVLIRDENGKRNFRRIDLNSSAILTSPDYYLKSNDILYAEPNNVRATSVSNQNQLISYGITGVSLILTLVTFFISISR